MGYKGPLSLIDIAEVEHTIQDICMVDDKDGVGVGKDGEGRDNFVNDFQTCLLYTSRCV